MIIYIENNKDLQNRPQNCLVRLQDIRSICKYQLNCNMLELKTGNPNLKILFMIPHVQKIQI